MLEIVLVYFLCKGIGKILRAKGRKPLLMQIMLVVCWIGGELMGGFVAGVMAVMKDEPVGEFDMSIYLFALIGAGVGAGVCFLIAYLIPPAPQAYGQAADAGFATNVDLPPSDPNNPYAPPR